MSVNEEPLNGEVTQSWSRHDRGLGQQWDWTQGPSIHLSSHSSQSRGTRRSTCQPIPFGEWLLILGQIKTQWQTLSISRLNCNLEDYLALGRLLKVAAEGLMWDLFNSKLTLWWLQLLFWHVSWIQYEDSNWSVCLCVSLIGHLLCFAGFRFRSFLQ